MSAKPSIVWFRQDLRLHDQPALLEAIAKGGPVIPLFNWAPAEEGKWAPGAASRWWLHKSLASLEKDLGSLGLPLIIRKQSTLEALTDLITRTGADAVHWNRCFEPRAVHRDARIKSELHKRGIKSHQFNASLLYDPSAILTKQNKPYQVFTPFWKACSLQGEPETPLGRPISAHRFEGDLPSDPLDSLSLLPKLSWDGGLEEQWEPGEKGAHQQLKEAIKTVIGSYVQTRNIPGLKGTSRLSPYLHFGEISVRTVWHAVRRQWGNHPEAEEFLRQLIWREFAHHLLHHFPRTSDEGLRPQFESFPWKKDNHALHAWQKGLTGYPIVDAGMRELWGTGWMHNRVRMIVGSFLVKDLLIDWREGARWFWDTLVDADLANNTLGWQWVGGCGADAAPYFRIFNPALQGEKFDPSGDYVRRWVPELGKLPDQWIHRPWEAPEEVLKKAHLNLGSAYPKPMVDHGEARKLALEAYSKMKEDAYENCS